MPSTRWTRRCCGRCSPRTASGSSPGTASRAGHDAIVALLAGLLVKWEVHLPRHPHGHGRARRRHRDGPVVHHRVRQAARRHRGPVRGRLPRRLRARCRRPLALRPPPLRRHVQPLRRPRSTMTRSPRPPLTRSRIPGSEQNVRYPDENVTTREGWGAPGRRGDRGRSGADGQQVVAAAGQRRALVAGYTRANLPSSPAGGRSSRSACAAGDVGRAEDAAGGEGVHVVRARRSARTRVSPSLP